MTDKTATPRLTMQERMQKYGFYASTFTAEELRCLDADPASWNNTQGNATPRPEFALLRIKLLRLARLTPLKSIDADQLDTLIKLVRVAAALDAMERTSVMRTKAEGGMDSALAALTADDLEDL